MWTAVKLWKSCLVEHFANVGLFVMRCSNSDVVFSAAMKTRNGCRVQVGKSSANFSMLSLNETDVVGSSNSKVALYKGLTVAVNAVDKAEINLTRQDLVELVNVRIALYRRSGAKFGF